MWQQRRDKQMSWEQATPEVNRGGEEKPIKQGKDKEDIQRD